ncbi:MAG: zinc-binding dehydrogenase [Acholeplasmataceae bacterium]|jgi:propanol-preferring alcohol dehydrogenase|nr:zinc-binding dehydrogenase [Acholeplasmataceae bacterium]
MKKGWQFTKTNEPLKLVKMEIPKAKPGEVILRTGACGICHTDVGVLHDEGWLSIMNVPIIMGHECAGTIIEVGKGVTEFKVGDRVAVCPTGPSGKGAPGFRYDGGFGTHMKAAAADLVKVPKGLTMAEAASATDAGMTSYHAIFTRGKAKPEMNIALIGIGGLGQFGLQALIAAGFENVYAVDVNDHAIELAKKLGAKKVVRNIKELKDKNLNLIVDFAGYGQTTTDAIETLAWGGTCVLVGMAKLEFKVNVTDFITGSKKIVASNGGTKEDIAAIYDLMCTGKLTPLLHQVKFDDLPAGIKELEAGKVQGRLVVVYEK